MIYSSPFQQIYQALIISLLPPIFLQFITSPGIFLNPMRSVSFHQLSSIHSWPFIVFIFLALAN